MTKLIGFYSVAPGEGKRTISQVAAKLLAQEQKVLYVELDYYRPSFAVTTGLSHSEKNFYNFINHFKVHGRFDLKSYIVNISEVKESNKRLAATKHFSENLSFLTLPIEFYGNESSFPSLIDGNASSQNYKELIQNFIQAFVNRFKQSNFDVVLFILPHYEESLFTLPIIEQCDEIIHVITANPTSLIKYRSFKEKIHNSLDIDLKNRWRTVINKVTDMVPESEYYKLFDDEVVAALIPYDAKQSENDFTYSIGTEDIEEKVGFLLTSLGFYVEIPKPKGFFRGLISNAN